MSKKPSFVLLTLGVLLAMPVIAWACGFFAPLPMDQTSERIIFNVYGNGTIRAIYGIGYQGEAEDFSWLVPVPSVPEVDVVEVDTLDILQTATDLVFQVPMQYCFNVQVPSGRGGGGGELIEGSVGPYDYAVLDGDTETVIAWLNDNGYSIDESLEPLIDTYINEGMMFLAMKLNPESGVGDIQPVQITYEAEAPTVPLRLSAVGALDPLPVYVWIFADTPYQPGNFVQQTVDYTQFRTDVAVQNAYFDTTPTRQYERYLEQLQKDHEGQFFVTEYMRPSGTLPQTALTNESLAWMANGSSYVTRLRTQISTEQMLKLDADPFFVPVEGEWQEITNFIDLREFVDPLAYWGCSTNSTNYQDALELGLERTSVPELNADVVHPGGWVQSEVIRNGVEYQIFAPEPVTLETIQAFFAQEPTVPMFVVADARRADYLLRSLGDTYGAALPNGLYATSDTRIAIPGVLDFETGVIHGLFTTHEDYAENKEVYDAMRDYLLSYQFYTHPDLRHTLYVGNFFVNTYIEPVPEKPYRTATVAFPEGWLERWENGGVVIAPQDGSSARVRVERLASVFDLPEDEDAPFEQVAEYTEAQFGEEVADALREQYEARAEERERDGIIDRFEPIEFEHEGRRGYVRYESDFLLVADADASEFDEVDDTLFKIADSFIDVMQLTVTIMRG